MRYSLGKILLIMGLLGDSAAATAQTTAPTPYDPSQTRRAVQGLELWPELQGELALASGDYLLLALRGERSTLDYSTVPNRTWGFDTRRLTLGYEHFWNPRWSWGATVRYEAQTRLETNFASYRLLVPELLLRHRAPLAGGFMLGQRLGLERQFPVNTNLASPPGGQFWARLRVDVERLYPLGSKGDAGLALRPRLSYEASTHLRFQKEATDPDERTIQFTRLRAEVGVRLSPQLDLTPWFAYQTGYAVELAQYQPDASGNMVQVRGGKVNNVYPTAGLDLRFTLLPLGAKADRQQLPTQH